MKINNNKNKGFTLVELLLVIAIIGILASILFIGMPKIRERARMTTFKENMRGLVTAATACHDSGAEIQSGDADGESEICDNSSLNIGLIPEITQCTGGSEIVEVNVTDGDLDTWEISSECNTSGDDLCTATCTANGCKFENCE